MYDQNDNYIISTNHYQGKDLIKEKSNQEQMSQSASVYRYNRISELLGRVTKNTPQQTIAILRNQLGANDKFIGWGNEKAINQLLCHHSIVFEPERKLVWVSTSPWQLGEFVEYDLNKIFSMSGLTENKEVSDSINIIAPDTFLSSSGYTDFLLFKKLKEQFHNGEDIDVNILVKSNPEYYHSYVLAGDYMFKKQKYKPAGAKTVKKWRSKKKEDQVVGWCSETDAMIGINFLAYQQGRGNFN